MKKNLTKLPDNWRMQIMDAKVKHDRHGVVALALVLPYTWAAAIKTYCKSANNTEFVIIHGNLTMWGADVHYGDIRAPIAASNLW